MTQELPELDVQKCAEAASVCACFNFRKATRAVTQHFDDLLASTGLRSTQLVILLAVAVYESRGMAALARAMVMDRSTLTRNLRPLIKQGFLQLKFGKDRRTRLVELTPNGRKVLGAAVPVWEAAQHRFVSELGEDRWQDLLSLLAETVTITWGRRDV
ncbi:MAG: winged helix-turn-helix transcriptional regulator [Planctomycetia bacterium]|nr:winged helix-turn-helix transcriptional regulator [Planctomycetia bacterium]